jgi:Rrf2 family transcriptional regulator, iron-sulfur cluster assembly transcription factor
MKTELGQTGDYAVRSALALARSGRRMKAREIAAEMALPQKFLPQVLARLIDAGLVGSVAGPDGGYELKRTPADISLLEVIEAAEGPVRSRKCVLRGGPCRLDGTCAVHDAWFEAQAALEAKLAATTFAELATGPSLRRNGSRLKRKASR